MEVKILSTHLVFPSTFPIKTLDFGAELLQQLENTQQIVRVAVFLIDSEMLKIFEDKVLKKGKKIKLLCDRNIDEQTKEFLIFLRKNYPESFFYKIWKRENSFHTKFIVFDTRSVIVGSHNLKMRSLRENLEISLLIKEPKTVRNLLEIFEYIYKNLQ
jgi:phosphatidylserine/phosphatidylglycerophosphate/cardiolipin synthase-like enzyme